MVPGSGRSPGEIRGPRGVVLGQEVALTFKTD